MTINWIKCSDMIPEDYVEVTMWVVIDGQPIEEGEAEQGSIWNNKWGYVGIQGLNEIREGRESVTHWGIIEIEGPEDD